MKHEISFVIIRPEAVIHFIREELVLELNYIFSIINKQYP